MKNHHLEILRTKIRWFFLGESFFSSELWIHMLQSLAGFDFVSKKLCLFASKSVFEFPEFARGIFLLPTVFSFLVNIFNASFFILLGFTHPIDPLRLRAYYERRTHWYWSKPLSGVYKRGNSASFVQLSCRYFFDILNLTQPQSNKSPLKVIHFTITPFGCCRK